MSVVGPPGGHEDATESGLMVDGINIGRGDTRGSNDLKDEPIKRHDGGQLEWAIPLLNAGGHPLSTPSLTDLDLDGTLEIVVASASDQVFALSPNGSYFWDKPCSEDVIDPFGQPAFTSGLDYEPPPFFTSVASKDVNLGYTSEIILGVKNGPLCLGWDGMKQWKMGLTTGCYFSTPCITDLEGKWSGNKEDLEIITTSFDESKRGWLEGFETDGGILLRIGPLNDIRTPATIASPVAADLDGWPDRGPSAMPPQPEDELDTELILCYPGVPLSIYKRNGTEGDRYPIYDRSIMVKDPVILVFGTPAVGNITGGPECEIVVPYCKGYGNWTNWTGGIRTYDNNGSLLWDLPLDGKGSGVSSSPAVAVFARGSEGPDPKVIVFGSDNGRVYVVDAESHIVLWQFDTGGRVLSSPAICNIDNDVELEMVIGSDSGIVFCFDLDPSDGIDEGISYPGDGSLYDVLWAYNTTTPIGISSPVIGDIGLDAQLEVVIGDSNGTLYCISAGGTALEGQKDWPEFHNDHSRTGLFIPPVSYGVDIYSKRDEIGVSEATKKWVEPGSVTTFNLTVENTGKNITKSNRDVIIVGIQASSVPVDWMAWLDTPPDRGNDNPGYVRLASEEKSDIILYVYAPLDGDIGEMAMIEVTAISSSNPRANDFIVLNAILLFSPQFQIDYNRTRSMDPLDPLYMKKWDKITNGATSTYEILLKNEETFNDTYEIQLSTPPLDMGWEWYFEDSGRTDRTVFLTSPLFGDTWGASKERMVLKVKAPVNALYENKVHMWVNATSACFTNHYPEIDHTKGDELILVLGHTDYPIPVVEPSILYIMPGETGQALINLSNPWNNEVVNYNISLESVSVPLVVNLPLGPVAVPRGISVGALINISVPSDAEVGEVYELTFFAILQGIYWSMPDAKDTIRVVIGKEHGFLVSPPSFYLDADEGDELILDLEVKSLWNGSDEVFFDADLPTVNWSVGFQDRSGNEIESVDLSNWSKESVRVVISIPFGTGGGNHTVLLRFQGPNGVSVPVLVPVTIRIGGYEGNVSPGVEISTNYGDGTLHLPLEVGETEDVWASIKNTGDVRESISISLLIANGLGPGEDFNLLISSLGPEDREMPKSVQKDPTVPFWMDDIGPDEMYVPVGKEGEWHDLKLIMGKGSTVWLHLVFYGPDRNYPYTVHLSTFWDIICRVEGYNVFDQLFVRLDPRYPDLTITGSINITSKDGTKYFSGETIAVSFVLTNTGDAPARDFSVGLWIDGNLSEAQEVVLLGFNDKDRSMTYLFTTGPGKHRVHIEIDPDNEVIESRDQFMDGGVNDNNVYETTIDVEGDEGQGSIVITAIIILAITVLIVTAVVLLTIYLRNKERKKSGAMERAEEE